MVMVAAIIDDMDDEYSVDGDEDGNGDGIDSAD